MPADKDVDKDLSGYLLGLFLGLLALIRFLGRSIVVRFADDVKALFERLFSL